MNKVTPEGGRFWDAQHNYSCAAPPWGELIAVNANTGDIAWRVPLGEFPELDAKGIKTGAPSLGGGITTAGNLVFIGATIDGIFRAFDARNGKELWREKLDAPAHSIPSTYMGKDGKQYVAVPAGGGGFLRSPTSDTVIAFRLNRSRAPRWPDASVRMTATLVDRSRVGDLSFCQQPAPRLPVAQGGGQAAAGRPQPGRRARWRRGGRGGGGPQRKRVLAWADTRNGQAQHDRSATRSRSSSGSATSRACGTRSSAPTRTSSRRRRRRPTERRPAAART